MAAVVTEAKQRAKVTDVVQVVRHGEKFIMPEGMDYDRAIKTLTQMKEYENQVVEIHEEINGFIWDALAAMKVVLERRFGFMNAVATQGWFGMKEPPQMKSIEVGINQTIRVPWGDFTLPGIGGTFCIRSTRNRNGMIILALSATVKRQHSEILPEIAKEIREELEINSIYRSKAIRLKLTDEDGETLGIPNVNFVDLSAVDPASIFFNEEIAIQIKTNIYTPILNTDLCKKCRIPLKRGIVLAGKYGTGKTLVAAATAILASQNGWTFIYLDNITQLAAAVQFARMYKRCIIFAEDIDRIVGEDRDDEVNEILNTIDGIDNKSSEIMVILTTNHVEQINPAMLRPGRLDSVIIVEPPDALTVQNLCRYYAGGLLDKLEDISEVGKELEGTIPSVIRECVERAKLYAISLGLHEKNKAFLNAEALLHSARGLRKQLDLINREIIIAPQSLDAYVRGMMEAAVEEIKEAVC